MLTSPWASARLRLCTSASGWKRKAEIGWENAGAGSTLAGGAARTVYSGSFTRPGGASSAPPAKTGMLISKIRQRRLFLIRTFPFL